MPEGAGLGHSGKLGAVAGFGGLLPLGNLSELVDLFKAGENRLGAQGGQLVAAEIVGAALHVADAQVTQQRFKEGNVAEVELVLKSLGSGGNNDALAGAQGREQVSQGFAGTGSGLDDQVAAFFQSPLDGLGHFQLPRPVLEREGGARQDAARREELMEGGQGAGWAVAQGHRVRVHTSS